MIIMILMTDEDEVKISGKMAVMKNVMIMILIHCHKTLTAWVAAEVVMVAMHYVLKVK